MSTAVHQPAGAWNRASFERELRETRRLAARVGSTALLGFGTLTAMISKYVYEVSGRGRGDAAHPAVHDFKKPLFMTFLSFVAMALCLVVHGWNTRPREGNVGENRGRVRRRARDDAELTRGLLSGDSGGSGNEDSAPSPERGEPSSWYASLPPILPALFGLVPITLADLVATALISYGLLHVPLSTFLMLRHGQLLFAALIAVCLRRELNDLHKLGMSLSFSGVALVALAAVLADPDRRTATVRGMAYITASQAVQAAQLTFEGYFLRDLAGVFKTPTTMVGAEGCVGVVLMLGIVLPAAQTPGLVFNSKDLTDVGGVLENTSGDTVVMLRNSPHLIAIIAAYVIGLVAYNYVGQQVSPMAGVASRIWLETLRTLACWFLAACLHHGNPSVFEGESLTWQMSTMQLGGFVMGTLGTLLYGRGDAAERQHIFERRLRAESDGGVAAPDLPGGSSRRSSRGRRERKPPRDSNRHELPRSGNSASGTDDDTGNEWSGAEENLLSPGRTSVDLAGRPPGSPASAFARTSAGREAAETVAAIARDGCGDGSPGTQPSGLASEAAAEPSRHQFTSGSFKATMSFSSYSGVLPEQRRASEPSHGPTVGSFGAQGANVVTGFHVRGDSEGDDNV